MPEFDWDAGNRDKCRKHGLTLDEIEHALRHGARVAPDPAHSVAEQRVVAVSRTAEGRPISARYMHAREVARYEQTFGSGDDDG
jgi:uncharacterized DUF497 family protein